MHGLYYSTRNLFYRGKVVLIQKIYTNYMNSGSMKTHEPLCGWSYLRNELSVMIVVGNTVRHFSVKYIKSFASKSVVNDPDTTKEKTLEQRQ